MAAGLGFKDFTTGEVLTAADVDGYLMQGIWVFASTAARNAAVTSPQEGNFAFTKDTNSLWYYDGAAWVASGATGDIEGVTAGIGISGGGTSGTVTVTNSMATAIDAKGDLIAGTGADTFAKLTVGANGTTLVADSAEATGLKWATPAAGGKLLQVVQGITTTNKVISSTTFTDTNLTATITPTSATSKILVIISQHTYIYSNSTSQASGLRLLRGATDIYNLSDGSAGRTLEFNNANSYLNMFAITNGTYLDSPATTSATTYKTQGNCTPTGAGKGVNFQENSVPSTITLLEIGA